MPLQSHLHWIQPVRATAHVYEAMERFRPEGAPRFLPVVHADGSVAGILRDDSLKRFLFGKYGYQLVLHHPLCDFVSSCVTVPLETKVESALSLFASRPNPEGLIVTRSGAYAGVLPTGSLLRLYEENRVRIQRQLMQSQKMEAIGTLAGGIAHDFNNILMPIMGYAELIQMGLEPTVPDRIRQQADQILQATRRARDLVDQILSFSRARAKPEQTFPLAPLIREVARLLSASIPSSIRILPRIRTDRDRVRADPGQVHQVLMNLCTNAAFAMREKGGSLEILLEEASDQEEGISGLDGPAGSDCLSLTVADSGTGIPATLIERIFEPFFTTKPQGEGTGLGLAVVHGIVTGLGGRISVASTPGEGTRFRVLIPRIDALPSHSDLRAEVPVTLDGPNPPGRVLLVDDEPAITLLAETVFERNGIPLEAVNDSLRALDLVQRQPTRFDLVVTDQTMPNLSGMELSRRLLAIRPDLPILLFTGLGDGLQESATQAIGIRSILKKPMSMLELFREVRFHLATAPAAGSG